MSIGFPHNFSMSLYYSTKLLIHNEKGEENGKKTPLVEHKILQVFDNQGI